MAWALQPHGHMRLSATVALLTLALLAARDASAADSPVGYAKTMQTCDGLAIGIPIAASAALLGGQGVLYLYAKVDTFFRSEPLVLLGAATLSAGGYLVCGPATHLAHGHPGRAAVSAVVRPALPAAAITLSYLALSNVSARPGDHFGPSGAELAVGLGAVAAVLGSFAGALLIDYHLAAADAAVVPAVAAVPSGLTGGISARW